MASPAITSSSPSLHKRILRPFGRCRSAISSVHTIHLRGLSFFKLAMAAAEALEPLPKVAKVDVPLTNGTGHVPKLLIKKLSDNAITPSRGSAFAAGYDISSAYDDVVPARGKALIKTDVSIAIPDGTYARLAPRSGLAWKHSIDVGAGVIDADYRGPVGVVLFNLSDQDFAIKSGDRVAQLILERIVTPEVLEVDDLEETGRGEGGFGSTGIATVAQTS